MNVKIYKIDKDTLFEIGEETLSASNAQAMSISHVHDSTISNSSTINFTIDIADGHTPYIYEEEFMVVIREKVDATSRGPHDVEITNAGVDIGKPNYNKKVPYRPLELPQGFKELKGRNE